MSKYFVKVEVATYYDKNYEVEATDELQASNIVKALLKKSINKIKTYRLGVWCCCT